MIHKFARLPIFTRTTPKLTCEVSLIIKISNMEQPKILVAIRKRPLSKKEATKGETDIVTVKNCDTVIVSEYK